MCGIAGFCDFTRDNSGPEWGQVGRRMADSLARRGPVGPAGLLFSNYSTPGGPAAIGNHPSGQTVDNCIKNGRLSAAI